MSWRYDTDPPYVTLSCYLCLFLMVLWEMLFK